MPTGRRGGGRPPPRPTSFPRNGRRPPAPEAPCGGWPGLCPARPAAALLRPDERCSAPPGPPTCPRNNCWGGFWCGCRSAPCLLEETAFRGVLWAVIQRRRGTGWATAVSSLPFTDRDDG